MNLKKWTWIMVYGIILFCMLEWETQLVYILFLSMLNRLRFYSYPGRLELACVHSIMRSLQSRMGLLYCQEKTSTTMKIIRQLLEDQFKIYFNTKSVLFNHSRQVCKWKMHMSTYLTKSTNFSFFLPFRNLTRKNL